MSEIQFLNPSLKRLFWPSVCSLILILFLYWLLAIHPYLRLERAHLAAAFIEIKAEQSGRITQCLFEEGAKVKPGDLLFSLATGEEKEKQKQLQASADSLQGLLTYHMSGVESAMQEYLTVRSEVEMGLVPKEKIQQPLGALQEKQTQTNECKQQLAEDQKNLELLKQEIQKKSMLAPVGGVIVQRFKKEGDKVLAGETVYSICDCDKIWVEATVLEKDVAQVAIGQKATIQMPSAPQKINGVVSWISPVALPSKKGVPIRISIEKNERSLLRPNLSAEVKIKTK